MRWKNAWRMDPGRRQLDADAIRGEMDRADRHARRDSPCLASQHDSEQVAFNNLPPDRRTIIVIVSEVARGGLTQAVLAIEDAHGRIDDALNGAPGVTG